MKNIVCLLTLACLATFTPLGSKAQSEELQQLLLNVEKLTQLKGILSDMKAGYQIYQAGYGAISDLSKGNFNLHHTYLGSLLQVSPAVRSYARIGEITSQQASLVREYKTAFSRFRNSGHFSLSELDYIEKVYRKLVRESLGSLEELADITLAGKLRMSDHERIEAIDRIYAASSAHLAFLRHFNRQGSLLSLRRARETNDVLGMQKVYGIHP